MQKQLSNYVQCLAFKIHKPSKGSLDQIAHLKMDLVNE